MTTIEAGFTSANLARAVVLGVVVDGYGHRLSGAQPVDVLDEERPVEGVGVVVVHERPLLERFAVVTQ